MTETAATPELSFTLLGSDDTVVLRDFRLVVAGYTGRDAEAVEEHIRELAAIGVPRPDSVPAFFALDPALATQAPAVDVAGDNTSGEVEPVLIRIGGRIYLGVGSDHTDRDIETESIAASKAACPKPVSCTVIEIRDGIDWDAVGLSCWTDGREYQSGFVKTLRIPTDVLALLDEGTGGRCDLLMFGGTVPVIGGEFIAGRDWRMRLSLPDGRWIEHEYAVVRTEGEEV